MAKVTTAPASDLKVISLISTGHCLSHVYQLALPNLFFLITIKEGFSIAELAILTSVFFAVSAVGQVIAGFMVDKHGARPILFLGFFLMALSIAAFAFVHSYAAMMVLSIGCSFPIPMPDHRSNGARQSSLNQPTTPSRKSLNTYTDSLPG